MNEQESFLLPVQFGANQEIPFDAVDDKESFEKGKIVTVRGTSGSGKSYIARAIKNSYTVCEPVYQPGRKTPLYYILSNPGHRELALIGSYENDCGGCDSIGKVTTVYELIKKNYRAGRDVFFEGLLHGADIKHTSAMALPITIIFLSTPMEECLNSINARRRSKGISEPVNPKNPEAKYRCVMRALERSKDELPTAEVHVLDRQAALAKCFETLGLQ